MRTIDQIQTYIANAQVSLADYWTLYIEMRADGDPNTAFLKRKVGIIKLYIVTIQSYIDNHPEELETINGLFNSLLTYLPSNFLNLTYSIYNPLPDNASGTIVISSVVKASNTIYGIVRLNVAPTSGADPVALGANDPRIATWDSAYALAQSAYDARVTASAFNTAGNLVLTKGDASTITTAQSVILNQSASAQTADFWISGVGIIEGQFTLPNIANDGEKPNVAVVDANGNFFKRTLAQLAADLDFGGFTASRAIVSDGSGVLTVSATTATQIGYLSTLTSNAQTQLDNKQPLDADLTAIAALTGNGLLRKSAGVWGMDTATYLTANQTITLSGDVSGSGSTAITTTIANDAVTFAKMQNISTNRLLGRSTSGTGNVEEITISTGLSLSGGALSSTITQYTDAMARASISETITGIDYNNTTGVFSLTAGYVIPTTTEQTNWTSAYNNMIVSAAFDTSNGNLTLTQQDGGTIVQDLDGRYLTANQAITLSGDVTGSGTTSIATTIANDAVTFAKMQNISTGVLLGRSTASSGNIEEISVGTGLVLSAGVLSINTLTASRAVVSGASGELATSATTATQIGYLSTLTSDVQVQINNKQPLDATLTALAAIGSTSIGFVVLNGVDSFATRVLEGATNRIIINNPNGSGSNPTIDIASNYAGQSSITTLGTVTSGVWNASPIADSYILSAANWNEAYDEHINSITFSTANGNLTANQEDGGNITVSLDGRYVRISGETMTGYLTLNANPVNSLHAATKGYVDSIGTGIAPKGGANAATTGTLPTYIPTSTTLTGSVNGALPAQDGVTLTVGQKLLVKNEVSNQYNGLYTVTDAGSGGTPYILTRTSNMDTWDELPRSTVFIQGGSTQAGYTYYCTVATGGTLGTTPVTFEIFSIGSVYTAGSGIDITGNTISIDSGSIVDSMISASAAIGLTKLAATTASRALVSDGSGYIVASATTATEVGYLTGLSGNVQTQINAKQPLDATLTALAAYNTNGFLVQTAADTFTGRTLQGQTNRIDITNADGVSGNPVIDISATYVGQNTISTVGIITSGVWNGTAIGDTYIASSGDWNTAYNNMIVSASFNTGTGLLTLTQQDTGSVTASLDGRYALGTSISGTTGYIPKFTASGAIGNSIVSESGGVISVAGALNITSTAPYVELTDSTNGVVHYLEGNDTSLVLYSDFGNTQLGSLIDFKVDGNTTRMSLSATELITFGATDTGEAHIFGGSARVNGNVGVVGNIVNNYGISGSTFGLDSIGLTKIANGLLFRLGAISGVTNGFTSQLNASNDAVIYSFDYGNVGIGTASPSSYSFNDPAFLVVANTSGNSTLSIVSSTTGIGYLAFADGTTGTDRYSGSIFYSHSTDTMSFKTAGSDRLEISSTGAATFSSSVAAGGTMSVVSTGVDGTFQDAFIARYSGNNAETNAILTAVSSTASGSGFRFDVSNGGGSSARTTALTLTRAGATFSSSVGVGTNPNNAKLEVVATTGEVFRADASGGAYRIVADQSGVSLQGVITLGTGPSTSSGSFELLTRNSSTGVLEKVSSSYYATAGSISGTTGRLAKFTSSGAIGDSIVSESGSVISVAGSFETNTTGYTIIAGNSSQNRTVKIGTGSTFEGSIQATLTNGTAWDLHINPEGGQIITNSATDTGEHFIIGGSARVNGGIIGYSGTGRALTLQKNAVFTGNFYVDYLNSAGASIAYVGFGSGGNDKFQVYNTLDTLDLYSGTSILSIGYNGAESTINTTFRASTGSIVASAGTIFAKGSGTEGAGYQLNAITMGYDAVNSLGWITAGGAASRTDLYLNGGGGTVHTGGDLNVAANFHIGATLGSDRRFSLRGQGTSSATYAAEFANGSGGTILLLRDDGISFFADRTIIGSFTDDGVNKLQVNGSVAISSTTGYQLISSGNTLFSLGYSGGTLLNRITGTSLFLAENGTPQLTIASGGAATFSSSVQANSYITSGGRTTSYGFRLPDWQIYNTSGGALAFNNYTTDFLTIASGGSATFSSSVTATSFTAGGRTRVEAGQIVDLGGAGNNIGIQFGAGALFPSDGTGAYASKNLGNSSNRWGTIFAGAGDFSSSVTATSFVKTGGTSAQFLKADGSVDSSTYLTTSAAATGYIQNQSASAQTASMWITGDIKTNADARIGGKVYIGANGAYIEEVLVGSTYELRVVDSAGNTTVIS